MNRALTSLKELEQRLSLLVQSAHREARGPEDSRANRAHVDGSMPAPHPRSNGNAQRLGGWSSVFDDLLENLRLEATLLNSAESPLMMRRREREKVRARRLAEAHALAEAQLEKANRQRVLLALREERASQERARLQAQQAQRAQQAQNQPGSTPPLSSEDWEASIEYTRELSTRPHEGNVNFEASDPPSELSISPDDSVFVDPDSLRPRIQRSTAPEAEEIKRSIPPRPRAQVTKPPAPVRVSSLDLNPQLIFGSLKGLLAPPPRITDEHSFINPLSNASGILVEVPWSSGIEITWQSINYEQVQEEIKGHESLSLAPRAFSPASPLPRRTISLRLKSTEPPQGVYQGEDGGSVPLEEDFNLSDFEEHRDAELFEMDQAYRALEEQVEDLSFDGEPRLDDQFYDRSWDQGPITLDEPSFTTGEYNRDISRPDTSQQDQEALRSTPDPFEALDDIHFDQSRLMGDFNWSEGTPTNVFGDEMTPTDVFEEQSAEVNEDRDGVESADIDDLDDQRMRPRVQEASQKRDKGLLSRFFRRR